MEEQILIFRTSTVKEQEREKIEMLFSQYPQIHKWNIDFEDWEKVLRIESQGITAAHVIDALRTIGIIASELE